MDRFKHRTMSAKTKGRSRDTDECNAFTKLSMSNQRQAEALSARGYHLGARQQAPPVPDRTLKPTYAGEGMSRLAALSKLYGKYPRYHDGDQIENYAHQTDPHPLPRYLLSSEETVGQLNERDIKSSAAQTEPKKLNKGLPSPPAYPHCMISGPWSTETATKGPYRQIESGYEAFLNHSYVSYRASDSMMINGTGFVTGRDKDARRRVMKSHLGPKNPFDDYYALSKTEEQELTSGHGAILPNPHLEHLERERQRILKRYLRWA